MLMAPNAFALSMESPYATAVFMMSREPEASVLRQSYLYGRSSVSPSLLHSRSSPQPSFRNSSFNAFEKSQSHHGGFSSRYGTPFRVQNSNAASDKKLAYYYLDNKISEFTPKRRTQSEAVSRAPIGPKRREFTVENILFPCKPCNSNSQAAATFKSKSVPSKLPFTAVTCAELEATVGKTRPKLFTCAELEALQVEDTKAVLKANDEEKKKPESPLILPAEGRKSEPVILPGEQKNPEASVVFSAEERKPESLVILPADEAKLASVEATKMCSWDQFSIELKLHQISVSRSESVLSGISTLEELSSRSNSPLNLCSSPVSSASSGYESGSSESCDSSPKSTVFDDLGSDSSVINTSTKKVNTVRKSLLSDFTASETKGFESRTPANLSLANTAETGTRESSLEFHMAIKGPPTKFMADANQADQILKKRSSKKSQKKKPLLSKPYPADLEMYKTQFRSTKNAAACGSSGKKSRKALNAALPPSPKPVMPPSPKTRMPLTSSPPGALQLPSPPQAWKSGDATACGEHGALPRSLDITREIRKLVGVAHISSPCRVAPGSTPINGGCRTFCEEMW